MNEIQEIQDEEGREIQVEIHEQIYRLGDKDNV